MVIYVSNLNFQIETNTLKNLFEPYGEVTSALVVRDKMSDKSRGFGFVEMKEEEAANAAITVLNGQIIDGKALMINVSKPKERSCL